MTQQPPYQPPQYGPPPRNRGPLIVIGVLGLVVVVLIALTLLVVMRNDDSGAESEPTRGPRNPDAVAFHRVVTATPDGCATPPSTPGIVCGVDKTSYTLGKVELNGRNVSDAAEKFSNGSWVVTLQLDEAGKKLFGDLTADLATKSPPANQIAIVVDGQVISAPSVASAIPGGEIEISGQFTQDDARKLADSMAG
ncbi:hypothetical protein [Kribbella sp. NPDC051770]|uniref:SecDF P1 head subdomain-containing protein n=1 Tax=Kribbella sp. NPDC051770 TaxID=3155413 RepID=UPI003415E540